MSGTPPHYGPTSPPLRGHGAPSPGTHSGAASPMGGRMTSQRGSNPPSPRGSSPGSPRGSNPGSPRGQSPRTSATPLHRRSSTPPPRESMASGPRKSTTPPPPGSANPHRRRSSTPPPRESITSAPRRSSNPPPQEYANKLQRRSRTPPPRESITSAPRMSSTPAQRSPGHMHRTESDTRFNAKLAHRKQIEKEDILLRRQWLFSAFVIGASIILSSTIIAGAIGGAQSAIPICPKKQNSTKVSAQRADELKGSPAPIVSTLQPSRSTTPQPVAFAGDCPINGTVMSANGIPIEGAVVTLPDVVTSTTTDANGFFEMRACTGMDLIGFHVSKSNFKPRISFGPATDHQIRLYTLPDM